MSVDRRKLDDKMDEQEMTEGDENQSMWRKERPALVQHWEYTMRNVLR